jgi:hypothetical protein
MEDLTVNECSALLHFKFGSLVIMPRTEQSMGGKGFTSAIRSTLCFIITIEKIIIDLNCAPCLL